MARIFRIVAHMPKKKGRYQVRRRTAGAGVTASCGGSGVDAMNSQLVRDPRESFNSRVHVKSLSKKNLTPAPQKERTKTTLFIDSPHLGLPARSQDLFRRHIVGHKLPPELCKTS